MNLREDIKGLWNLKLENTGIYKAENGLAVSKVGDHTFVAFAADPGQTALDEGDVKGLSPFTEAVVKYMGTRGLELSEFMQRVAGRVRDTTKSKKLQRPWTNHNFSEDFYFKRNNCEGFWTFVFLGTIMGFIASLIRFTKYGQFNCCEVTSYLGLDGCFFTAFWWNGIWFGSVVGLATWRWGKRDEIAAFISTCIFMVFSYMSVLSLSMGKQFEPGLEFWKLIALPGTKAMIFVLIVSGMILALGVFIAAATFSPALRRAESFAIFLLIGLLLGFISILALYLQRETVSTPENITTRHWILLSMVGAFWHSVFAYWLAKIHCEYVPDDASSP